MVQDSGVEVRLVRLIRWEMKEMITLVLLEKKSKILTLLGV